MRVFTTGLLKSAAWLLLVGMMGTGPAWADEALRQIQQSLRTQGFYYGPIDGSPGDETTQALRRYQIRNGLTVNGQLTDETRRSIERTGAANGGSTSSTSSTNRRTTGTIDSSTPPPLSTPTPAPSRRVPQTSEVPPPAPAYRSAPSGAPPDSDEPDVAAPAPRGPGNIRPDLCVNPGAPSAASGTVPNNGIAPSPTLSRLFASTPYEFAPPPVQADVLRRVQILLTRNGFYDGRTDGVPGPPTAEALKNFQEVNRLRRTGRLDVSTLGTMRLLPGRQTVDPRIGDPRRGPGIIFPGRPVD